MDDDSIKKVVKQNTRYIKSLKPLGKSLVNTKNYIKSFKAKVRQRICIFFQIMISFVSHKLYLVYILYISCIYLVYIYLEPSFNSLLCKKTVAICANTLYLFYLFTVLLIFCLFLLIFR